MEDSAQMIWPQIGDVGVRGDKPWLYPPSNMWHPNVQHPVVQSYRTVSGVSVTQWGWWSGGRGDWWSLESIYAGGPLGSYDGIQLWAILTLGHVPLVSIHLLQYHSLPAYQVFRFPSEHLAIQNMFDLILLNSVMYHWWRQILLDMFSDGIHIVGPQ